MKDIITLEVNSKKDVLGNLEIETPNEFLLVDNIDAILNNNIFEDFIDEIFILITEELASEFDKKIDNVYVTFVDDDDVFICSVVLDRLNKRKGTYRMQIIDWKINGFTYKYVEDDDLDGHDNNLKAEF